jgi:1,4-dihydroxy-2-naphthoate octaprenyltransferase
MRIEGLIPFTGSAILIGSVVTLWEAGSVAVSWGLFIIAALAALLIHIDAHLWNDIMDLELDRREKSRETGRERPLVNGWATVKDYRRLSAVITFVVVVLAAYLTVYRIWIPVLFVIGFLFDYGYNHPRIALAYRPFTEWYIFPWLVVAVTVTVVYAATGIFSPLAFILSLLHGMTVTCFVVSMMRRDVNSDRLGGKCTSSVQFPGLPHSTIYGLVTMVVAVLMVYPLLLVLGDTYLAYIIVVITAVTAGINTVLGARIDQLCTRARYSVFPGFEAKAHTLMLQQIGVSIVHVVTMCLVLAFYGRVA